MANPPLVLALGFLAALSLATHATHQGWLGFALAPLALLVVRLDSFRFLLLSFACYLFFFESSARSSTFLFFDVPDSLFIAFVAMSLLSRPDPFRLALPGGALPLLLGLFVAYGLLLSVYPLRVYGILDIYVLRDLKNLLYLALAIPFCLAGKEVSAPGNVYRLLIAIVAFTALHALVALAGFAAGSPRAITWNEVYFADSILICAVLLRLDWSGRMKLFLRVCLGVCVLGLLATQTRGLWLSTVACLLIYAGIQILRNRGMGWRRMAEGLPVMLILLLAVEGIFRLALGKGILDFVQARLSSAQPDELIDPFSSMGYRLHESAAVWEKRSWFGHGSGARLYLFFTQLGMSKFINWWSIHSEYFELLHKYGFLGLGLFMAFLAVLLRRSWQVAGRPNRAVSALGLVALLTVLNHMLVSVTSGYLIRENVMIWLVLMVVIAHRYRPRAAESREQRPVPAPPASRES